MFITNESMQVLKAGKATVSGSYKVGQVVTFQCGDGSTQKAKCTHAFYANANMPVGEFKPLKRYKFTELCEQAKDRAIHEYAETACCSAKQAKTELLLESQDDDSNIYSDQGVLLVSAL